ncbi:hypothetical protein HMPREF0972_00471 [Actinomyces sp. oral taxon 848 str. F0332]|nr:hypothetical protein HMPREF0972_00471 [Actinomyces sp. oral taxon 848 str. F0332]
MSLAFSHITSCNRRDDSQSVAVSELWSIQNKMIVDQLNR